MITLRGSPLEVVESFSHFGSDVGKNAKVDGAPHWTTRQDTNNQQQTLQNEQ